MILLLDTHVWLWTIDRPDRLGAATQRLLEAPGTDVRLSIASAWELATKCSVGKLRLQSPPDRFVPEHVTRQGITLQSIELDHALRVAGLPMHHRDPFDRLLVAQAQALDATIATIDPQLADYDVALLDPR